MMLRSPLPAAAASHTASHVSFPLFFFFLTSARGGAATARPLTSPLLARLRPGGGRGGGGPGASASPGPRGLRDAQGGVAGRGGGRRWGPRRAPGASLQGAEPSAPAYAGAQGGGVPGPARSSRLGLDRGPESPRRLLSPDRGPTARPRAKAAQPRLREKREIAKFIYSQIDRIIV